MKIDLKTGILSLEENKKLDSLIGFGSRINKKRGFLFVSKVLGKHLPVKPFVMKNIYKELAKLIPSSKKKNSIYWFCRKCNSVRKWSF